MKSSWRIYFTPLADADTYGDEIDVTEDVDFSSFGNLQKQLDNNDFDIGVLKNSNVTVSLNNLNGLYSDVDVIESMFRYTRNNSIVRITFSFEEVPNTCGMMIAGQTYLASEIEVFKGFLNDDSAQMSLSDHKVPFTFLGLESLFDNVPVGAVLNNGDGIATSIYNLLNQSQITQFLTIDLSNINPAVDQTVDDVSSYANQVVSQALSDLLLISSSVLYILNDTVYVTSRTPSSDVKKTFYGQASPNGTENIALIESISTGFSKIFNYLTWNNDPSIIVQDSGSILKYKIKNKEFNVSFFTDPTKIDVLLGNVLNEFKLPEQEFLLTTPIDYQTIALNLLDRVTVDYPPLVSPIDSSTPLPICGLAVCGQAIAPKRLYNFSIDPPSDYKIMNVEIDFQTALLIFKLRKI